MNEKILVLDFGGQYDQLIARRVREQHVYAEIRGYDHITADEIEKNGYKGIIFTGGPNSVYEENSPQCDPVIFELGIPILGICYGDQLMAHLLGGQVKSAEACSEYGKTRVFVTGSLLFEGIPEENVCWMSHTDYIAELPEGFRTVAMTEKCTCAAMEDAKRNLYGVQFHPEVNHTVYGKQMLYNFLFEICGCRGDWKMEDYLEHSIERYCRELAGKKVLLALSGGVDSSVAAVLLQKAIGDDLTCVFEDEGKKLGKMDILAQGTIYPDVVESGTGDAAAIKSHHNVGGLPDVIAFEAIVEPLRELFKDEVRKLGEQMGLPHQLVWRQPFPGPGLAVRVIGEVTKEKMDILREVDAIFCQEVAGDGLENMTNQYFAVLTDLRSVGVKGDARTYGYTVALRAVTTDDFMTAEWTRLPYEVLEKVSNRITNEVAGITRVVYDITSKPPATVEWE